MFKFLKNKVDEKTWDSISRSSVIGLHLVSGTFVGLFVGYCLDKWLGTAPWLLLIFLILGIVAGFVNVFRDAKKISQNEENTKI